MFLLYIRSAASPWDTFLVGSGLLEPLSLFSKHFYVYKYREEKQYSFHHPIVLRKKKKKKSHFNIYLRTEKDFSLASSVMVKYPLYQLGKSRLYSRYIWT